MEEDPYFQQFKRKYFNVGIGGLIQYDTRDDVATPTRGMLLGANFKLFGNIGEALITTRSSSLNTDSLKTYFVHAVRLPGLPKARSA